jgi:hypothetical protein
LARRDAKAQEAHDKGVHAEALELRRDGWNVLADLPGWTRPPLIAGRRPDIYATKRGHTRIVEIETDEQNDHDQRSTFRRHAGQKGQNTTFIVKVVNSTGRRIKTLR